MININSYLSNSSSNQTLTPHCVHEKENVTVGSHIVKNKNIIVQKPKSAAYSKQATAPSYNSTNYASAAELPQTQSDLKAVQKLPKANVEEDRKSICFVISDEEIFFSKERLIQHSPYIASLVQDLDANKVSPLSTLKLIVRT